MHTSTSAGIVINEVSFCSKIFERLTLFVNVQPTFKSDIFSIFFQCTSIHTSQYLVQCSASFSVFWCYPNHLALKRQFHWETIPFFKDHFVNLLSICSCARKKEKQRQTNMPKYCKISKFAIFFKVSQHAFWCCCCFCWYCFCCSSDLFKICRWHFV